jgi:hypothetical protein
VAHGSALPLPPTSSPCPALGRTIPGNLIAAPTIIALSIAAPHHRLVPVLPLPRPCDARGHSAPSPDALYAPRPQRLEQGEDVGLAWHRRGRPMRGRGPRPQPRWRRAAPPAPRRERARRGPHPTARARHAALPAGRTRSLVTAAASVTSGPGVGGRALLSIAVRVAGALSSPSRRGRATRPLATAAAGATPGPGVCWRWDCRI